MLVFFSVLCPTYSKVRAGIDIQLQFSRKTPTPKDYFASTLSPLGTMLTAWIPSPFSPQHLPPKMLGNLFDSGKNGEGIHEANMVPKGLSVDVI